jgi:hypothetical protein
VATVSQLSDRLRAEIGDIARSFVDTFTGDGITNRYQLSQAPIQGYTLIVKVGNTDVSANVTVEEGVGVLTFGSSVVPPNNSVITVTGQAYRYFTDSEISYYINTAFLEHAAHTTDTSGSRITQIGLLPPIEEYPVVLLASTMALYTLANDSAFDIDIISPDGVSIPRSERYRQLMEMLQARKEQYKELCAMLNIGMYRIEVQTLRRISRLTNRYVPVYRPQEVDDGSIPQRVYLNMPDYGDITPPTTALVRDISMYSGDDFLLDFQFSFDLTNFTPKGQVRIFTSGDYAQVGPLLLGEFTITKVHSSPTSLLDTLQVTLPGSITANLPRTAYYDIQMTHNTDNTVRTYVTGKVFTRNQVTI